jgi:signal transduction histidine kinase
MSPELVTINPLSLLDLAVFAISAPLAVGFYAVYVKLGKRLVDLIFANILLCTSVYAFAALMVDNADAPLPALIWTRIGYIVGALGAVSIAHFIFELTGEHSSAAHKTIPALYGIGFAFAALTYSPLFLQARTEASGPRGWLNVAPWLPQAGPLQWAFALFWFSLNGFATFKLYRSLPTATQVAKGHLHHTKPLLIGFFVLMVTGTLDALLATTRICSITLVMVGSIAVCLPAAVALGRQLLEGEIEKQRFEESLRVRDTAVRDVAHELKGALTPIGLAASTLLDRPQLFSDESLRADLLNVIVDESERLTRLINNILDVARLEAGRPVELRLNEVNLHQLVESVVETQRLRTNKHRLEVQFSSPLDPVMLDPDKVHQILTNLLDNAIKYSPDGGRVLVDVSQSNGDIAVRVSDEGIGMTPEQQARLFQPFSRVLDPARKITGTGIGLHLIKGLVEAHGGKIWVQSETERGSAFTFTLPQHNGHAQSGVTTNGHGQ